MKLKHLLFAASLSIGLCAEAQIHPGAIVSWPLFYNAPANHTKEVWTIMGFTYYTINISRDANNYVTAISSTTGVPSGVDLFKATGSISGNVYTAITQMSKNGGAYKDWRKDTWQSDGTNDTLIMWADYDTITSTYKNVAKNSLTYSAGLLQSMMGYTWNTTTSGWAYNSKNIVSYVSGKKDKVNNFKWDIATSAWVDGGYMQYFYTGNRLDSMQEWVKDQSTSITSLKYRYIMTADANNKTASFQQLKWKESGNIWENTINISFTSGTTGINEVNENGTISVYPVPANDVLTIDLNNTTLKNAVVKVYSLDGKEMINVNISETLSTINTTELNNGLYLVFVESNGIKIHQQKLIIAH